MNDYVKLAVAVLVGLVVGVAGSGYMASPEKKAFDEFLAKCKANPELADCQAWEASKRLGQ